MELQALADNIRAFTSFLAHGTRLKIWEENRVTVQILSVITTKSRSLMYERRVLHHLLCKLGIAIKSEYLPSPVKCFADSLLVSSP